MACLSDCCAFFRFNLVLSVFLRAYPWFALLLSFPGADVGEVAGDGGGGGHLRADEVGAAAAALAAFEVAVGGGGAALAGLEDVGVHAEAHAAAGLAPIEAGGLEDGVEAFGFGLALDRLRAGDDHGANLEIGRASCRGRG